ncbi:MAG: GntR family transcriptional regulator [Clostridia bacterium]
MLVINKQSQIPIYEQIVSEYERLIMSGFIMPSEQIPSVRALAMELTINPNTIQKAYNNLELRKITYSVPGVGRFISVKAKEIISEEYSKKFDIIYNEAKILKEAGYQQDDVLNIVKKAFKEDKNV